MLLLALAAFILGALLSAAAPGLGVMIAGRAMQGVAAGLIPLGISLMHDLLPRERAGKAIALMSASMGIGGSLGLSFSPPRPRSSRTGGSCSSVSRSWQRSSLGR